MKTYFRFFFLRELVYLLIVMMPFLIGGCSTDGEDESLICYQDIDGDGYGNPNVKVFSSGFGCPIGYVSVSDDCNDLNADAHPGAIETPDNGIDEDCNGSDLTTGIIDFQLEYGGSGEDHGASILDELGYSGGFTISGGSSSGTISKRISSSKSKFDETVTDADMVLIKTDANGTILWVKRYGGDGSEDGTSHQKTTDGGYILAGSTDSIGAGNADMFLVKVDANGEEEWEKTFGGSTLDVCQSVQQTSDGGYILAGLTGNFGAGVSDIYIIKTDSNGNKVWEKTFGGSTGREVGSSIQEISGGGYILAGMTESFGAGNTDVYLIKIDASGNKVWEKTFGDTSYDRGRSVKQISTGGFIIVGETYTPGAPTSDLYLLKVDNDGNKVWGKTFGGDGYDWGMNVKETSDGGFVSVGGTDPNNNGDYDIFLVKTNSEGNINP